MGHRRLIIAGSIMGLSGLIAASCGGDGNTSNTGSSSSGVGGAGGSGGTEVDAGPPPCATDAECNGGVCNSGTCCASAALVCGTGCCVAGDVCLFGKCVVPGADCFSSADCPTGNYCETALGESGQGGAGGGAGQGGAGGGAGQGGGATCTQSLTPGKCLPLPVACTGMPNDPPDCVPACEYHPPPGQLNAVVKWQWGNTAPTQYPGSRDLWATPTVARITDANCDGKVDMADPANVIFVSGNAKSTCCSCSNDAVSTCRTGVLRVLDGTNGKEVWSLNKSEATSVGFAGLSVAIGDVDQDQVTDIVAMTGEGKIAVIGSDGVVKHVSSTKVAGNGESAFGWGGGIALGDMNNDGWPEIAYGRTVFTMEGGTLKDLFTGTEGGGGVLSRAIVHFADLDGDGTQELITGRTAYRYDGSMLWNEATFDGFTATGDFDGDNLPEIVVVNAGQMIIREGATGAVELGPIAIPGSGNGGPPTVADFDGDGKPEIGVAMQNFYSAMKPDYVGKTIATLWSTKNHDNSSSVTGSSVFDFEGDGKAEVIYNDECFLWVYDGQTGAVLFSADTQSFTATEASVVADVDGDGHAEILMIANGADPTQWTCAHHTTGNDGYPVWSPPPGGGNHRGITAFADAANSWVGTRTLWNQHAYSVSNVCDPRDGACDQGAYYGQIPAKQKNNWELPWLNNFRQNVQDKGLFDAPDVAILLDALCASPVTLIVQVRNAGLSGLPTGVQVDIFRVATPDELLGSVFTSKPLMPGQTEIFTYEALTATQNDTFRAQVFIDPKAPKFHECREDNNQSTDSPGCPK